MALAQFFRKVSLTFLMLQIGLMASSGLATFLSPGQVAILAPILTLAWSPHGFFLVVLLLAISQIFYQRAHRGYISTGSRSAVLVFGWLFLVLALIFFGGLTLVVSNMSPLSFESSMNILFMMVFLMIPVAGVLLPLIFGLFAYVWHMDRRTQSLITTGQSARGRATKYVGFFFLCAAFVYILLYSPSGEMFSNTPLKYVPGSEAQNAVITRDLHAAWKVSLAASVLRQHYLETGKYPSNLLEMVRDNNTLVPFMDSVQIYRSLSHIEAEFAEVQYIPSRDHQHFVLVTTLEFPMSYHEKIDSKVAQKKHITGTQYDGNCGEDHLFCVTDTIICDGRCEYYKITGTR